MNFRDPKAQLRVNCPDAVSDVDALEPIQSQYAASPRLVEILVRMAALYDLAGKDVMTWWFREFNPATAQGHGLDVWARIVGATRQITRIKNEYFGFDPSGRLCWQPNGISPEDEAELKKYGIYYRDQDMTYQDELADEDFRLLIFWKAAVNIGAADADTLNSLLARIFPGKKVWVQEIAPMHIRVVSRFELDDTFRAIFKRYGVAGRGAGVFVDWLELPDDSVFGFTEQVRSPASGLPLPDSPPPSGWQPFGNGTRYAQTGGQGTFFNRYILAYTAE